MGYTQQGEGTLTLTLPALRAAVAALPATTAGAAAEPTETLATYVSDVFDVIDKRAGNDPDTGEPILVLDLFFTGGGFDAAEKVLDQLAAAGASGMLELTGEDGTAWQEHLRGGSRNTRTACRFFPADPTPDAFCAGMSAADIRTVMALAAGAYTDELPGLLDRLTAALP